MEFYQREFFIYRIMSGYLKYNNIRIYHPDIDTQYDAQEIYIKTYHKALEDGLYTDKDVVRVLFENGLWTEEDNKNFKEVLPGHIEYWKVELFNSYTKSKTRENVRKYLQKAKDELLRLFAIRHELDYATCEGLASFAKNQYILENSCRYNDNTKVNWNEELLHKIMSYYQNNLLIPEKIRVLSRTTPWANLWMPLRKNGRIFDNVNLSYEQSMLISWSCMYDSISESPDCPPEEIVNDDDALDGWLLVQKRKREADKNKSALSNKIKDGDEVFIPAETQEDARKIEMLNDPVASAIKRQRFNQIKEKGSVNEGQFADVKQDIMIRANQAYINSQRRK